MNLDIGLDVHLSRTTSTDRLVLVVTSSNKHVDIEPETHAYSVFYEDEEGI